MIYVCRFITTDNPIHAVLNHFIKVFHRWLKNIEQSSKAIICKDILGKYILEVFAECRITSFFLFILYFYGSKLKQKRYKKTKNIKRAGCFFWGCCAHLQKHPFLYLTSFSGWEGNNYPENESSIRRPTCLQHSLARDERCVLSSTQIHTGRMLNIYRIYVWSAAE